MTALILFITTLTPAQVLFWWSIIGIVPYQLTFLRKMFKEKPKQLQLRHYLQALPFGIIVILSVWTAGVMCKCNIINIK